MFCGNDKNSFFKFIPSLGYQVKALPVIQRPGTFTVNSIQNNNIRRPKKTASSEKSRDHLFKPMNSRGPHRNQPGASGANANSHVQREHVLNFEDIPVLLLPSMALASIRFIPKERTTQPSVGTAELTPDSVRKVCA